jgi:hypothetical protein
VNGRIVTAKKGEVTVVPIDPTLLALTEVIERLAAVRPAVALGSSVRLSIDNAITDAARSISLLLAMQAKVQK